VNKPESNPSSHALSSATIGVFDSGVGGLSILREIRKLLPSEDILYLADQAHVPYGTRTLTEVRQFSDAITRFFLDNQVKLIVIACNTASAAALLFLRRKYPSTSFVGMEPAVKPAAQISHTQRVGVLATEATFQGALYASVVKRFAKDVIIYESACPGLVSQIEEGKVDSPETHRILKTAIQPMLEQGVDTIVLGCTHYPFVISLIRKIAGPTVDVIDPAPAIARQTKRVLEEKGQLKPGPQQGQITVFTTGSPGKMQALLPHLVGENMSIRSLKWQDDKKRILPPG
jgi:glutamate racemase